MQSSCNAVYIRCDPHNLLVRRGPCGPARLREGGIRMEDTRKYQLFAAWCIFFLAALNLLDLACTSFLIARYGTGVESNPLVVAMWNGSPLFFVLYKVALSALLSACGLCRRKFRKWCVVAAAPAALYCCVVGMSLYFIITLRP